MVCNVTLCEDNEAFKMGSVLWLKIPPQREDTKQTVWVTVAGLDDAEGIVETGTGATYSEVQKRHKDLSAVWLY